MKPEVKMVVALPQDTCTGRVEISHDVGWLVALRSVAQRSDRCLSYFSTYVMQVFCRWGQASNAS